MDPNGKVTLESYDSAGRVDRVWLPTENNGTTGSTQPSYTFAYFLHVSVYGAAFTQDRVHPTVCASQLQSKSPEIYVGSCDLLDGIGRVRQHKTISPEQVALLKEWIKQGAKWGKHWSYEKVVRPVVPQVSSKFQVSSWGSF